MYTPKRSTSKTANHSTGYFQDIYSENDVYYINCDQELYRGNSSKMNPLMSSSTVAESCNAAATEGVFLALTVDVAQKYGKYVHVYVADTRLRILDMSTVGAYHTLRNWICNNEVMTGPETATLLALFDEAYVMHPDGKLARLSSYDTDGPLFRGIQFLFSKGVFSNIDGIGNSKRIGTFHPEAYIFSKCALSQKDVLVNTDKNALGDVMSRCDKEKRMMMKKDGRKRARGPIASDDEDSDQGFRRKLFSTCFLTD